MFCEVSHFHLQFLSDFVLLTMPSIEEPSIQFCYMNTMEDAFLLWWYWLCKGQSGYQPNQPHPLIGFTQRPCQDSLSWPFSSVSGRIFRLYWCILLLQKLIQQQHICRQNIVTNGSGIAVCQIVERITTAFFLIFFGHQGASTKATWVNGDNW